MLKIKKVGEHESISVRDMKRGDIGIVSSCIIKAYVGLIVQKSDNLLISLGDPEVYWNFANDLPNSFQVRILPKGTEFILE